MGEPFEIDSKMLLVLAAMLLAFVAWLLRHGGIGLFELVLVAFAAFLVTKGFFPHA